jgi:ketosteroid isomerase-like protein
MHGGPKAAQTSLAAFIILLNSYHWLHHAEVGMFSRMRTSILSLLVTGAVPASLIFACATNPTPIGDEVQKLIELSRESNAALMRGDAAHYGALVRHAEDFTLMSPFGGKPSHGAPNSARMQEIGKFFKNGSFEQEVVHSYASPDMIVLAIIERTRVEAGGLPAQDWALRVTLVYRREGSEWRLAHRHADPLVDSISLTESAALARGERTKGH